jgi:hypothetical protein
VVTTSRVIPIVVSIVLVSLPVSVGNAQQQAKPTKAVQLAGLIGVKNNTKGNLTVENGNLHARCCYRE